MAEPLGEPEDDAPAPIDVEAVKALRWATGIEREANLLALCRSLPPQILAEQVAAHKARPNDKGQGGVADRDEKVRRFEGAAAAVLFPRPSHRDCGGLRPRLRPLRVAQCFTI